LQENEGAEGGKRERGGGNRKRRVSDQSRGNRAFTGPVGPARCRAGSHDRAALAVSVASQPSFLPRLKNWLCSAGMRHRLDNRPGRWKRVREASRSDDSASEARIAPWMFVTSVEQGAGAFHGFAVSGPQRLLGHRAQEVLRRCIRTRSEVGSLATFRSRTTRSSGPDVTRVLEHL